MSSKKDYKFKQRVETRKKGAASKTVYSAGKVYPLTGEEAKELRPYIERHVEPVQDDEEDGAGDGGESGGEGGQGESGQQGGGQQAK